MNTLEVADAAAMDTLGMQLGQTLDTGNVVFLSGELGAGKTTLVRGVLHGLGYQGKVRSPTYTLMEAYEVKSRTLQHLDLYRIREAVELEDLGLRDLDDPADWVFVEWPELGAGRLPRPDLEIRMEFTDAGRRVHINARSERGRQLVQAWGKAIQLSPSHGLQIIG